MPRNRWGRVALLLWLLPAGPLVGRQGPTVRLGRGVNVTFWRAPSPRLFTPQDARSLRSLGFDFVRLQVSPTLLQARRDSAAVYIADLGREVDTLNAAGLAVVIDMHAPDDLKLAVLTDSVALSRYLDDLRLIARVLASRPRDSVALELLNEPRRPDRAPESWDWNAIQSKLWEAVRKTAPQTTIVATGDQESSIAGLLGTTLLPDSNVVYAFHYYQPILFTYQGASWGFWASTYYPFLRSVPYPASPARVRDRLGESLRTGPDSAHREQMARDLERYGTQGWNSDRLGRDFESAALWGRAHGVRVLATEFGAWANYAAPADRDQWLRDVRTAAERTGMGWALWRHWDYGAGFGLLQRDEKPDPGMLSALGLGGTR